MNTPKLSVEDRARLLSGGKFGRPHTPSLGERFIAMALAESGAEVEIPATYPEDDAIGFEEQDPEIGGHVEERPNFTEPEERLD